MSVKPKFIDTEHVFVNSVNTIKGQLQELQSTYTAEQRNQIGEIWRSGIQQVNGITQQIKPIIDRIKLIENNDELTLEYSQLLKQHANLTTQRSKALTNLTKRIELIG